MAAQQLKALVADDESDLRDSLRSKLERFGILVNEASDGAEAWKMISENSYDLVLLDVRMPEIDGLEVLERIKDSQLTTSVAIVTAHANVGDAVKAIQNGAFDYIEKPIDPQKLEKLIQKAIDARSLVEKIAMSRPSEAHADDPLNRFVGQSKPMSKVYDLIRRLAHVNTSVLIRGENGTGKELVAQAIHYNSPRKDKAFVAVNCGAIPSELLESEFFGHEKGAFTGAVQRKIGKFQHASGGTLFLDEIGDLPLPMQVKLLRSLQEQKITPVGSNREVQVDVRIIAATNQNLETMMANGRFRSDLYYRLNVMPVYLPPLRDRKEDIPALVEHFVAKFNQKHDRNVKCASKECLDKMLQYEWPGNIRELENAIEHAFIFEQNDELHFSSFPEPIQDSVLDSEEGWTMGPNIERPQMKAGMPLDYKEYKDEFEKNFIIEALKTYNGRINMTCEKANIPKNTLLRKIRKYKINPKDYES